MKIAIWLIIASLANLAPNSAYAADGVKERHENRVENRIERRESRQDNRTERREKRHDRRKKRMGGSQSQQPYSTDSSTAPK